MKISHYKNKKIGRFPIPSLYKSSKMALAYLSFSKIVLSSAHQDFFQYFPRMSDLEANVKVILNSDNASLLLKKVLGLLEEKYNKLKGKRLHLKPIIFAYIKSSIPYYMFDPLPNSKKMELICLDSQAFEMMFERLVERIKEENKVQDNPHLNTKEACELLRCNDETLRKYWKEGHIARVEFSNKHIVYDRASLLTFIEKNTKKFDDGSK